MYRGSTPRHAQTAGDLGFAVQFIAEASLSFGRIVPRVTIGRVTPFIPCERPNNNGKHAIAGYLGYYSLHQRLH